MEVGITIIGMKWITLDPGINICGERSGVYTSAQEMYVGIAPRRSGVALWRGALAWRSGVALLRGAPV